METFDESLIIGEDDFDERMQRDVLPWVEEHLIAMDIQSADGTSLRAYSAIHENEKAAIVISHGFCEFVHKYHELMYYFYAWGYSVFFVEYRGHGYSDHILEEMDRVTVRDYDDYVADLDALVTVAKEKSLSKKLILFAHSMGGCVGALYMERYPDVFAKAVLSSPLLQMNFRDVPDWAVSLLVVWSTIARWDLKYVPGQHGFDHRYVFETSSAMSKPRYDYVFAAREADEHYTSYGGTYAWTKASIRGIKRAQKEVAKITVPVLLFQAEKDTMVKIEGQTAFCDKLPHGRLIQLKDCKHEIFNALPEQRLPYYREMFAFLSED